MPRLRGRRRPALGPRRGPGARRRGRQLYLSARGGRCGSRPQLGGIGGPSCDGSRALRAWLPVIHRTSRGTVDLIYHRLMVSAGDERCPERGPAQEGSVVHLPVGRVRFSQPTISRTTHLASLPITTTGLADAFKKHGYLAEPIDVVRMPDGELTTLDNRRLWAARKAGLDTIPAHVWASDYPLPRARAGGFMADRAIIDRRGDLGSPNTLLFEEGELAMTMAEAVIVRCGNRISRHGVAFPMLGSRRAPQLSGVQPKIPSGPAIANALGLERVDEATPTTRPSSAQRPSARGMPKNSRGGFSR